MQNPPIAPEQFANVLLDAINNPDLIRGGKAVDTLRNAVQGLYNGIDDRQKQIDELKAKLESEAKEVELWRKKYEELEKEKSFVLTANGKH